MWRWGALRSRSKGGRASDDPARHSNSKRKAGERDPPFASSHRLSAGIDHRAPGDHRLGQPPAAQVVEDDGGDVQRDQGENDVEPAFVEIARLV